MMSSAGDSEATTHPPSRRPRHSGRNPFGIAHGDDPALVDEDQRVGALEPRQHADQRAGEVGLPRHDLARDQLGDQVAVAADGAGQHPGLVGQRGGVGEVAVVAEGEVHAAGLPEDRLRVAPGAGAAGRVAGVADGEVAGQAAEGPLVEHVGHQAHVLDHGDGAPVGHRDPGRLLATVLERVEAEVGQVGDGLAGRVDAEDAAGFLRGVVVRHVARAVGPHGPQCARPCP